MKHKHLSLQERYYIEIELKKGSSQNAIAKALNRQQGWDLQFKPIISKKSIKINIIFIPKKEYKRCKRKPIKAH
jgi:hypothetical protein